MMCPVGTPGVPCPGTSLDPAGIGDQPLLLEGLPQTRISDRERIRVARRPHRNRGYRPWPYPWNLLEPCHGLLPISNAVKRQALLDHGMSECLQRGHSTAREPVSLQVGLLIAFPGRIINLGVQTVPESFLDYHENPTETELQVAAEQYLQSTLLPKGIKHRQKELLIQCEN